jgi:Flp pilus assembly protein TadG
MRPTSGARGQASVEFALVSIVLVLLLAGAIEFGQLYATKLDLSGGARAGARWAATHASSWSAAAAPPSDTIEGQVQSAGGAAAALPNNDSGILIEYFAYSAGTTTACGHYSQAAPGFVGQNGYTQVTCLVPGTLIRLTVTGTATGPANAFANIFPPVSVKAQATMPELS